MPATTCTSPGATPAALANDLSSISTANMAFLGRPHRLLIDGRWTDSISGRAFEVRDPSSDRVIASVALGEAVDVDRAVVAARRAFEDSDWSRMKPVDRESVLRRIADLVERHNYAL